jgi:hypothetical protein
MDCSGGLLGNNFFKINLKKRWRPKRKIKMKNLLFFLFCLIGFQSFAQTELEDKARVSKIPAASATPLFTSNDLKEGENVFVSKGADGNFYKITIYYTSNKVQPEGFDSELKQAEAEEKRIIESQAIDLKRVQEKKLRLQQSQANFNKMMGIAAPSAQPSPAKVPKK